MVKKWLDANKIVDLENEKEIDQITAEDYEMDFFMREIPNAKRNVEVKKVYENKEYIILKVGNEYIVQNTKKEFKYGHTHIKSFNIAKTIIDNCIRKKRPKTNNLYLLESHIRISKDKKYIKILQELLEARSIKGDRYININKGKK